MSVSCLTIIVIGISILFELSKQTFNDYCSIFAYPKVFSLGSHILKKRKSSVLGMLPVFL